MLQNVFAPGTRLTRWVVPALALALMAAAGPAPAQPLAVDPTFAPQLIDTLTAGSRVRLHSLEGGGYLARGPFSFSGPTPASGVARLLVDGSNDSAFAYAGATTTSGFANTDEGVIPLPDGRVLTYIRTHDPASDTWNTQIDAYLATGALDVTFTRLTIAGGYILLVRPERNGGVLIAGLIPAINGTAFEGVARITPDGSLDSGFVRAMAGPTSVVSSLVLAADGSFTASGYTTSPAAGLNFVRRYHANGAPDTLLQPAISASPAAPPALLASQADGRIIVRDTPAVRWMPDGSIDASFNPSLPAGDRITAAVAYDDGRLLIQLEPEPTPTLPAGLSSVRLLAADGSLLTDYRSVLGETGAIHIHDVTANGDVLLRGSDITSVTVVTVPPGEASPPVDPSIEYRHPRFTPLNSDGGLGATIRPDLGVPGSVMRVVHAPNDRVHVSGDFDLYDGVPVRGLIRLEADGTSDASFIAPPILELPSAVNAQPLSAAVSRYVLEKVLPDGRLLVTLRLQHPTLARPRMARLLADGSLDPTFDLRSTLANGSGRILDVDATGRMLVMLADVDSREVPPVVSFRLAVFDASGGHVHDYVTDLSGPALGSVPNASQYLYVRDARLLPDDRLMVAGPFDHVDGVFRPGVARLLASGALDESYVPEVVPGTTLHNVRLLSGGRALAMASDATTISSMLRPVRLQADGRLDPTFHAVEGAPLANPFEQPDGSILDVSTRLRRLRPDGSQDLNVDVDLTGGRSAFVTGGGAAQTVDEGIIVGGGFSAIGGMPRFGLARLVPFDTPGFTVQPVGQTTVAGRRTSLQVAVGDIGAATYQWQRNGVDVPGANGPLLVLESAGVDDAGEYRAVVTVGSTTYVSNAVTIAVTENTTALANFSARSRVQSDGPPQIAGFITSATTPHPVLLRSIGPNLANFGVGGPLLNDRVFSLFAGSTRFADGINAWDPVVLLRGQQVGAFVLTYPPRPQDYEEYALASDLGSGIFTAQTAATAGDEGVSLFEFYDAAPAAQPGFVKNVSLRGRTAPGAETMIGGFILAGNGPRTLLLRGIGAELAQWDVPEPLADPQLTLFAGDRVIATSNDWADLSGGTPEAIAAAATATGAFPLETTSPSAAILILLEPGAYTVHATANTAGVPNESILAAGEVLLEIYLVEP